MIGHGAGFALHLGDRHFTCLGKQLRQMASVARIQMLNQDEGHAGIVRQIAEKLRECLQSAGGSSHAYHDGQCIVLSARLRGLSPL